MTLGWEHHHTARLLLSRPRPDDIDDWHVIHSDPLVWEHFPSGRHVALDQTEATLAAAAEDWTSHGLGYWSVRSELDGRIIGCGGCRPVPAEERWNLYYRFTPGSQGNGYATELASAAIEAAHEVLPAWPVVAYMLEHNVGSWKVAEHIGMHRVWTGPDAGNPDPTAVRFVYADRVDEATRQAGRN